MQMSSVLVVAVLACASAHVISAKQQNPIPKVVTLLEDLKGKIEADGKSEQKSYDKFACWCEDTLAGKAKDISDAKQQIEELQTLLIKLKGDLAVHAVEVKQLEKDIAVNLESQRQATEVREKENEAYREERTESEQCIGALEAAITVLHGAGAAKFLETLQQAQLLSVVDGVRGVLREPAMSRSLKPQDLLVVKSFVDRPEDFLGGSSGFLSAVQITNNPFGDYAPQSTQIQGILKGMYDTFAKDLEAANAEEAQKQKGFEVLMAIKKQEMATMKAALATETMSEAEKTKLHADNKKTLRDTQEQLEADEKFFDSAKTNCQAKAGAFAVRTGLRIEELHGIARAIAILSDDAAQKTFKNATSTFLQVSQTRKDIAPHGVASIAYKHLKTIATATGSLNLARIAAKIQSGGHFNGVINAIENMVKELREEEVDDERERDFCTKKQLKNTQEMEDLDHDIKKSGEAIKRHEDDVKELDTRVKDLKTEINATKDSINELKGMRSDEDIAFMRSVKDDLDAIDLLEQAIESLSGFYTRNGIPLSLIQAYTAGAAAPSKYEPMPDTSFQSGNYQGRSQEGSGIIAILGMIKEDLENEIKEARKQNGASGQNYMGDLEALENTLSAYESSLTEAETQLADLDYKIADENDYTKQKQADLGSEKKTEAALKKSCDWVKTHFESRREKRRTEIDGLIDAKNYLAGLDE